MAIVLTAANGSFVLNGQVANLSGPSRGIARRTDIVVEPYSRRSLDVGADQTQVIAFLIEELRRVENALRDIGDGASQVVDKAPLNPRKGMIRFAVNPWNPGSGDGLYTYTGSAWAKLH